MGIANFGSFLGGLAQGAQAQENNRERAAYLLMMQKKQQAADEDTSSTRQAVFENRIGDADLASNVFSGSVPPPPAQTPQPGQPSQPMMQPGAQPMQPGPYAGTPNPMAQPPRQGPQPTPQQPPQQLPGVQAPRPYAAPQQPVGQPPQPGTPVQPQPQQPQQPADGFARAQQILDETRAKLETPEAQAVAADPGVQKAQKQYHDYIKELQGKGIQPGGQKPDLVQMKRLELLHEQLVVASAEAAKHVGADRKAALDWGKAYTNVLVRQEAAKQAMDRVDKQQAGADRRAGMRADAKGGAGGGGVRDYETLNETEKSLVDAYVREKESTGKFPTGTGYNDPYKRIAEARWGASHGNAPQDAAAVVAANAADKKSMATLTPLADRMDSALSTLHGNFQIAIDAAKKANLGTNMPMNQVSNYLRQKGGNEAVAAFESAVRTAQGEYAKLLTNSTSAGGSSVESLKRASDSINPNMTLQQLIAVQKVLEQDGKNVTGSLRKNAKDAEQRIKDRETGGAKSAPRSGGGASAGPTVSAKAISEYAKANGMTEDAVRAALKARGASVGE